MQQRKTGQNDVNSETQFHIKYLYVLYIPSIKTKPYIVCVCACALSNGNENNDILLTLKQLLQQ